MESGKPLGLMRKKSKCKYMELSFGDKYIAIVKYNINSFMNQWLEVEAKFKFMIHKKWLNIW